MTIQVKIVQIAFENLRLNVFDVPKFRGYLAERYPTYDLIHNHISDKKFRYAYPSIQFKVLNKTPTIIGIGEGIEILKQVFIDIDQMIIEGKKYSIDEKSILLKEVEFGQSESQYSYEFITPYMALNQNNYEKYKDLEWNEKRKFVENILRGNLKSMSKGFNYFIPDFENLHIQGNFKSVLRNFKNIKMICFDGTFTTNFIIPDYLGIGKQTARGFGTVLRHAQHPGQNRQTQQPSGGVAH